MTFVCWNPAGSFLSMPEQIDHLFHEAFEKDYGHPSTGVTGAWEPPVDSSETENATGDEIRDPILRLSGKHTRQPPARRSRYEREKYRYGVSQGVLRLPTIVSAGQGQSYA